MPTVKLRGEGWLALPAEFRRKLKIEVADGAIRLRVVGRIQGSLWPQEEAAAETAPAIIAPEPEAPIVAPKRRGRPPKAKSTLTPQEEARAGAEREGSVAAVVPEPATPGAPSGLSPPRSNVVAARPGERISEVPSAAPAVDYED